MSEKSQSGHTMRVVETFKGARSLHPLVVGHMCKQDKNRHTFSKRYFALYEGGLLVYYSHQKDYENDVAKNKGMPLHCTLVLLKGLHLTRPTGIRRGIKHSFILHAPDTSNHRNEFLLVCQSRKDMRIWVDQLQSQNNELAEEDNHTHKAPPYIRKLRLQLSSDTSRDSIEKLNSDWLKKQSDYHPGDIALKFHTLIDQ